MHLFTAIFGALLSAQAIAATKCAKGTAFPCDRFVIQHPSGQYWSLDEKSGYVIVSTGNPLILSVSKHDDIMMVAGYDTVALRDEATGLYLNHNVGLASYIPSDCAWAITDRNNTFLTINAVDSTGALLKIGYRSTVVLAGSANDTEWRFIPVCPSTIIPCYTPNQLPLDLTFSLTANENAIVGDKVRIVDDYVVIKAGSDLSVYFKQDLESFRVGYGSAGRTNIAHEFWDFEVIRTPQDGPVILVVTPTGFTVYKCYVSLMYTHPALMIGTLFLHDGLLNLNMYDLMWIKKYDAFNGTKLALSVDDHIMYVARPGSVSTVDLSTYASPVLVRDWKFDSLATLTDFDVGNVWITVTSPDEVYFMEPNAPYRYASLGSPSIAILNVNDDLLVLLWDTYFALYQSSEWLALRSFTEEEYGFRPAAVEPIYFDLTICVFGSMENISIPQMCCFDASNDTSPLSCVSVGKVSSVFVTGNQLFMIGDDGLRIMNWTTSQSISRRVNMNYGDWNNITDDLTSAQATSSTRRTTSIKTQKSTAKIATTRNEYTTAASPLMTAPSLPTVPGNDALWILGALGAGAVVLGAIMILTFCFLVKRLKRKRLGKATATSMSSMSHLTTQQTKMSSRTERTFDSSITASVHTLGTRVRSIKTLTNQVLESPDFCNLNPTWILGCEIKSQREAMDRFRHAPSCLIVCDCLLKVAT